MLRVGFAAAMFAALTLFSCTTDKFDEGLAPASEPAAVEITDPFTVPLDEALDKMYDLMDEIYGPATRASTRSVAGVETLKGSDFGGMKTRSGAALPNNLAYVVNFTGGQGFAVLGANVAAEPVYCITDAGSFTTAEMNAIVDELSAMPQPQPVPTDPVAPIDPTIPIKPAEPTIPITPPGEGDDDDDVEEEEEPWVSVNGDIFAKQMVLEGVIYSLADWTTIITATPTKTEVRRVAVPTYKKGPLLNTEWDQDFPYNYWCPWVDGVRAPAGCTTIAVVQVIAYAGWPQPWEINRDAIYSWENLKPIQFNNIPSKNFGRGVPNFIPASDLAAVISTIGSVHLKTNYTATGSSSSIDKAAKYFKKLGYNTKLVDNYKPDHAEWSIYAKNFPLYIRATNWNAAKGEKEGHAWLIDGCLSQDVWEETYVDGVLTKREFIEHRLLLHCNWGWGGLSNGYYAPWVFNSGAGPIEKAPGDKNPDNGSGNWDRQFRCLQIY